MKKFWNFCRQCCTPSVEMTSHISNFMTPFDSYRWDGEWNVLRLAIFVLRFEIQAQNFSNLAMLWGKNRCRNWKFQKKNLATENDQKDAKFTQMIEKELSKWFCEKYHMRVRRVFEIFAEKKSREKK